MVGRQGLSIFWRRLVEWESCLKVGGGPIVDVGPSPTSTKVGTLPGSGHSAWPLLVFTRYTSA
jgi:hypothetical protein